MRRRLYLIPAAVILFILFFTVFGERGLLRIYELNREKRELSLRSEALIQENERLKREIEALKTDRRYLESIARKDFGLVRPNEIVYQFAPSEGQGGGVKPGSEVKGSGGKSPEGVKH